MALSTEQTAALKNAAIGLAIAYGVYRFAPGNAVKGAALGVMGTIVALQLPYVGPAIKGA